MGTINAQSFSTLVEQVAPLPMMTTHDPLALSTDATKAGVTYAKTGDQYLLSVPSGVTLTEPIMLQFSVPISALTIAVGSGSHVQIVELITLGSAFEKLSHTTEIQVDDESVADILTLQTADATVQCSLKQSSKIGAGSRLFWHNVTLGGKTVEQSLKNTIAGEGSESSVDWVFYAKDLEKYTLSAHNNFLAGHGSGEIIMKGIAEQKAHAGAKGMIEIGPEAGETDTYLTQEVLMLDPTAKVDAVPGLEIKTNDVKASHSATVARVTPEDLFYFAARGIPEKEARHMYVRGFLGSLTERIATSTVREVVLEALEAKYIR